MFLLIRAEPFPFQLLSVVCHPTNMCHCEETVFIFWYWGDVFKFPGSCAIHQAEESQLLQPQKMLQTLVIMVTIPWICPI